MTSNEPTGAGAACADMADRLAALAARSGRIAATLLASPRPAAGAEPLDPGAVFVEAAARLMADPSGLACAQARLWEGHRRLWLYSARRLLGEAPPEPVAAPASDDRRFRDSAWTESPFLDHLKQSYLLASACVREAARAVPGLSARDAEKVEFYARQFVDALAPVNFLATNPEALRETVRTGGRNLLRGLETLLDDLERGEGSGFAPRMSDRADFTLGETIAATPGKVVFQNDLMQLIQYAPRTKTVFRRPLLVVPPWINKFYVLDLRPDNSFVRYAVSRGYTVFMLSWVNPDECLSHKSFADYMMEGPLAALDAIALATGEREVSVVGYCLGGTLTAAALACSAARGDGRIVSATFFASLVDFAQPGEIGVFLDDAQLEALDAMMAEKGYLDGRYMAAAFSLLRANDLVWSFAINNYLLGKEPPPFDLLYWNADSTRMPAAMHGFYLREMYGANKLVRPGGIVLDDVPVDLRRIEIPTYVVAAREDHIAPWRSCFAACGLYRGRTRFVLGDSGHIAGIVNPPAAGKYGYRAAPVAAGQGADSWLAAAAHREGSWWPDWHGWQRRRGGGKVPARHPGAGALTPVEDAPGSYVAMR